MNGAFYIGATGLQSQERALQVVANNIANLNTPAFKRSLVRFSELMGAPAAGALDAVSQPGGPDVGGVLADTSARIYAQGELRPTGNPNNIAIDGGGFIELMGPSGQDYLWRGGVLKVNEDGYLAAGNGMVLKAMISVPAGASDLTVAADGTVRAVVDGQSSEIGKIEVAMPRDMSALSAIEGGLYLAGGSDRLTSVTPGEEGGGLFVQGSLEASNVDLSEEMIAMLLMQRAYAANAQVVQAGDQLMSIANGLRRG
ncbi:MAG TPA: flagellar hook basal-body protein [Caulobacteraceae bacterium]|jgi:flagellar basal-body rod protein FlgG